jgi:hypothetical protein
MSKNLLNLLLIVAIFAMYYLVISPMYKGTGGVWQPQQSITMLKEMNKQYDETLAQAESLSVQAEQLKSDYARISDEDKAKMAIMVPDSIDKVRLLSEVVNVASKIGMPLNELSYAEGASNQSGRGSALVSFTTKTTYAKFKEFIDAFEKSMRLYSIQSVSFSAPDKEGELINFQVKLETYYMK